MAGQVNKIVIGEDDSGFTYINQDILSLGDNTSVSLVGQELGIDTMTFTVRESKRGSTLVALSFGQPIYRYRDEKLVGKFYLDNVVRTGKISYQVNAVSFVGLLDTMYHRGGLYVNVPFADVIAEIMSVGFTEVTEPVVDYTLEPDVAELIVNGYLPYATKRSNLHQLLFAYGVNLVKDALGNPYFTFIFENPAMDVPKSGIFNTGKMQHNLPASEINITEHAYVPDAAGNRVVLFDNTTGTPVQNRWMWFDQAPVDVSSIEIDESIQVEHLNPNGAMISGMGTITGIPFVKSTNVVSYQNESAFRQNVVNVTDGTMVNATNSANLLLRLQSYYADTSTIYNSMEVRDYESGYGKAPLRCGINCQLVNPFDEETQAFVSSMSTSVTSFSKAECELLSGYTPQGQSGLYKNFVILDKETFERDGGVFQVPDEVFESEHPSIRVVIIGGGWGGESGYPGKNGREGNGYAYLSAKDDISEIWYGAEGGDGGKGGEGGLGGTVRSVVLSDALLQHSYQYTIGDGGEGGSQTTSIPAGDNVPEIRPNPGKRGTASTFGDFSSDDEDAIRLNGGFYNPFTAMIYASKGVKGIQGGKGGARIVAMPDGTELWTTDGESVSYDGVTYAGGVTGKNKTKITELPEARFAAYGGNGAGAAVGVDSAEYSGLNGGNAPKASYRIEVS